jgi:hypothetical protein
MASVSHVGKDIESGAPLYNEFGTPKPDDVQQYHTTVRSASIPMLLLLSCPRMAIQMAWPAQ